MSNIKIIIPEATTNLITNPSFETGTTGWAAGGTNTIAQSSAQSFRGNYSLLCTYQNSTTLVTFVYNSFTASTTYYLTGWLYVPAGWDGGNIRLANNGLGDATDTYNNLWNSNNSPTATWVYLETQIAVGSDTSGGIMLMTTSAPTAGKTVYLDCVQLEQNDNNATTYCDGDQDGCRWIGARHASQSSRPATSIFGGRVDDLEDDYNYKPQQILGAGMPPYSLDVAEFPLGPGGWVQGSKIRPRVWTIAGTFKSGSLTELHSNRKDLTNAIKHNRTPGDPRLALRYSGANANKSIETTAIYEGGLELTNVAGFKERAAMRLLSTDVYYYELEEEGDVPTMLGTVTVENTIARNAVGTWHDMDGGVSGTGKTYLLTMLESSDGLIYVGGRFSSVGTGLASSGCAYYDPDSDTWGSMDGGVSSTGGSGVPEIYALAEGPNGDIYVGGDFTKAGSTPLAVKYFAKYTPSTDTWSAVGTPPNGIVYALAFDADGDLWIGGEFSAAGGATGHTRVTRWDGSSYNQVGAGFNNTVHVINANYLPVVLFGGDFTSGFGAAASHVAALWKPTTASLSVTTDTLNNQVSDIVPFDNRIYVCGQFNQSGNDTGLVHAAYITSLNAGQPWQRLGLQAGSTGYIRKMTPTKDGLLAVGTFIEINSDGGNPITLDDSLALWDGSSWNPLNIDLPSTGVVTVYTALEAGDQSLYLAFDATGTATVPQAFTLTNNGTADAYPIIEIDGPSSGVAKLFNLSNLTTNENIWFDDYQIQAGETIRLDLRQGHKSFKSLWVRAVRGSSPETARTGTENRAINQPRNREIDIFSFIRPSSDWLTWHLAPGDNQAFLYTDDDSVALRVRWRIAHISIDGAAT